MKKLVKAFKWLDDRLLPISIGFFIVVNALIPKARLADVQYTYIKIRYDDFLIIPVVIIFLIQLFRKKVKLRTNFLVPILLFWGAVFLSYFIAEYVQRTVLVHCTGVYSEAFQTGKLDMILRCQGLLHSIRRVQYMIIFFIAASAITSESVFLKYMRLYLFTVFLVTLYGLGQKFLQFPSIQSMNPAYVDSRILILKPEDRINATFGGHFDLAAYLVFSMPILLGFLFAFKKRRYLLYFILSLMTLLYTSARSSFVAYVGSISLFLLWIRKFKFLVFVALLTAVLLFVTGEMTKRLQSTFQIKTIFVNLETGQTSIDQKLSTKELPAGDLRIKFPKSITTRTTGAGTGGGGGTTPTENREKIYKAAYEQAKENAKAKGEKVSLAELERRAQEIAKVLQPQRTLLCDISCSTRLQIEWPRAIAAFLYNPYFGTGPSSLGEATDNSFLRWLGEFGLLGTSIFVILLYSIMRYVYRYAKRVEGDKKYIYYGYIFAMISLLINALYVDVFEASKVAYNLWLVTGFYVGAVAVAEKQQEAVTPPPQSAPKRKKKSVSK